MLLQVHDELVLEAPPDEVAIVGPMLVAQMKKAAVLAVPLEVDLRTGIERTLQDLTRDDASRVYEAIRLARPGGLGRGRGRIG